MRAARRCAGGNSGGGFPRPRRGEYKSGIAAEQFELSGRRAAVTGAAGFIGSAVCRRLAAEEMTVVGLDVNEAAAGRVTGAGAEFVACDIRDPAAVDSALEGADLVVHTAAYVREWGPMEEFIELNVRGTVEVLDAAERQGAERVVHLSSVVIYGFAGEGEQDEEAFHRSLGVPYIDTKGASDRLARRRGAIVVRPGDVYGPGSVPWTIRVVDLARAGQLAATSGQRFMLPVYIDDLVDAVVHAAERGEPGQAYTAWSGEKVQFGEYFDRVAEIAGGRRVRRLPRPVLAAIGGAGELGARILGRQPTMGRHGAILIDRRGTVSIRRAREELGWEPKVMLDEGLRRSAEWLRAEGMI